MTDVSAEVRKLAADHYDEALSTGRFSTDSVIGSLIDDLVSRLADGDESVTHGLIAIAARSAVDAVDRSRIKENQLPLFEAFDQPVKLGAGERLARGRMIAQDWATHLGFVAGNAAKVNAAAAKENMRFAALAPYLVDGTTTEAAFAAWQKANPGKDLL